MKNEMFIDENGPKRYFSKGQYHRIDGPAVEYIDGTKYWYRYGKVHRLDGPAVEYIDGRKYWYYEDIAYNQEKHPFNVFRKDYNLSEIYEEWSNDMKMLFKLTYG
jgi:hypothetical protein